MIDPRKSIGCKKGRKSGGILLYCKSYLKPSIKVIKYYNTYIWFEIHKSLFFNIHKNIRICAVYFPPESSNYYTEDLWEDLKRLEPNYKPYSLLNSRGH